MINNPLKAPKLRFSGLVLLVILTNFLSHSQGVDTLLLLHHWKDTSLVPSQRYINTYNEVWGMSIQGKEYAIIGSTQGTHILPLDDLSSMDTPFFIPGSSQGDHVIHRDYHDFEGYLYAVCDEGVTSTLQIIDMRNPQDSIKVVYDSNELFTRAHNIFIDSSSALLYVCAQKGNSLGQRSALAIYDLQDPTQPRLLQKFDSFGGQNIGHVHDAYVKNDTAFLNCGFDGLHIVDFSNPTAPVLLASLTDYPFRGYNHSGWVDEEGSYYYMADETHGAALKTIDISNIRDPEVMGTFSAESPSENSIPHNPIVHCGKLYVSYYFDGLQVFELEDPTAPRRAFEYPTSQEPHIKNYRGAWGVFPYLPSGRILVSDMQEGLFIIQGPECQSTYQRYRELPIKVKIYPNPGSGNLFIDLPEDIGSGRIEIYDLQGRVLKEQFFRNGGKQSLVTGLPSGYYIIRVASGNRSNYKQFVIAP